MIDAMFARLMQELAAWARDRPGVAVRVAVSSATLRALIHAYTTTISMTEDEGPQPIYTYRVCGIPTVCDNSIPFADFRLIEWPDKAKEE